MDSWAPSSAGIVTQDMLAMVPARKLDPMVATDLRKGVGIEVISNEFPYCLRFGNHLPPVVGRRSEEMNSLVIK